MFQIFCQSGEILPNLATLVRTLLLACKNEKIIIELVPHLTGLLCTCLPSSEE